MEPSFSVTTYTQSSLLFKLHLHLSGSLSLLFYHQLNPKTQIPTSKKNLTTKYKGISFRRIIWIWILGLSWGFEF
jgi:hypothetical protein